MLVRRCCQLSTPGCGPATQSVKRQPWTCQQNAATMTSMVEDRNDAGERNTGTVLGWQAAAEVAGISTSTLRRRVKSGELIATQDEQGCYQLQRSDLDRIRREQGKGVETSSHASKAFAAFKRGLSTIDVVIELDLEPSAAEELFEAYARLSSIQVFSGEEWSNIEELLGPLRPADLAARVEVLLGVSKRDSRIVFCCSDCGEPVRVTHMQWAVMLQRGALADWGHDEGQCPVISSSPAAISS